MPTRTRSSRKKLTAYEAEQVDEIARWKSQPPNPLAELWNLVALQAAKAVTFLLPDVLVRSAIEASYKAAEKLAARHTLAARAGVDDVTQLRKKSLEECDKLASEVARISKAVATAEGAATGMGGMITTAIDVPLQFVSALRTIVRMGYCYGYAADKPSDRYFNLGILTTATAGSLATRLERLDSLHDLEEILVEETQVDLVRSELLSFLFQLEVFEEIPGIGVVSGALLNLSFMHRVNETARKVFQERWLKDGGKVSEIAPFEDLERNLAPGLVGLSGRAAYSLMYHAAFGATFPNERSLPGRARGGPRLVREHARELCRSSGGGAQRRPGHVGQARGRCRAFRESHPGSPLLRESLAGAVVASDRPDLASQCESLADELRNLLGPPPAEPSRKS
jgi:EcsC protein family